MTTLTFERATTLLELDFEMDNTENKPQYFCHNCEMETDIVTDEETDLSVCTICGGFDVTIT